MKFKNETSKVEWKNVKDSTAKKFAESWATEMERMLECGGTLEDVAFKTFETSLQKNSITGQEEYEAAGLLGQYWYKGNELYHLWTDGGIIPE